jgi:hypothetical protein
MRSKNKSPRPRSSRIRTGSYGRQRIAAIVLNGSVWFETGPTDTTAILRLLGSLERNGHVANSSNQKEREGSKLQSLRRAA